MVEREFSVVNRINRTHPTKLPHHAKKTKLIARSRDVMRTRKLRDTKPVGSLLNIQSSHVLYVIKGVTAAVELGVQRYRF